MQEWLSTYLILTEKRMRDAGLGVSLYEEDEFRFIGELGGDAIEIFFPEEDVQNTDYWIINYNGASVVGKTLAEVVRNLKAEL